jgi:hypothetical protein
MAVSSEGEGVGAMRTWEALNITAMEVLVNQTSALSLFKEVRLEMQR